MTSLPATKLALLPVLVVLGGAGPAVAASSGAGSRPPDSAPARTVPADTAGDPAAEGLPGVLDSIARRTMTRGRIPGLAVLLVRDGEVSWSRGYGEESLDGGPAVSPRRTLFSVGSVSKLVTAVAAMQLVEDGRLSLHADVRRHVPDSLPPPGPGGPVTLHHLLTHTAGFESASVGLAARSPEGVHALRRVLAERMPPRVRPPGLLYLYSQFDYGLAGLAVEEASDRPFGRLVRERIFVPLGMGSASFRPRAQERARRAVGYHWTQDGFRAAPTAYHQIPPAGGLVATPHDLGRLMAALVGGDSGPGGGILAPRTVETMFARRWSPHPHPMVEGTAYGLFEYRACGFRALSTRGWVGGHTAYLHLVPERNVGFLVVGNASSLDGLESTLRLALHGKLSGSRCTDEGGAAPDDGGRGDARAAPSRASADLTGLYRSMGFGGRGVEALGRWLLSPTLEVRGGSAGLELDLGSRSERLTRVDSLLVRAPWGEGREEYFSFLRQGRGDPGYLAWEGSVYERIPRYLSPSVLRTAAALGGLLLLTGLLSGIGRPLWYRWGGEADPVSTSAERLLRHAGELLSVLPLVFALGVGLHLTSPARYEFAFGIPSTVVPLLWLPLIWTALAAALSVVAVRVWRRRYWSVWERIHWSLLVATALAAGGWLLGIGIPAT